MATWALAAEAIPTKEAVFDRVDIGDCWVWTGSVKPNGYGKTTRKGRQWMVHRLVWSLLVGVIPEGATLDHLCRNRLCCNPDHLREIGRAENVLAGYGPTAENARKTHCVHGHPFSEENTYTVRRSNGYVDRRCKACHRRRNRESAMKNGVMV